MVRVSEEAIERNRVSQRERMSQVRVALKLRCQNRVDQKDNPDNPNSIPHCVECDNPDTSDLQFSHNKGFEKLFDIGHAIAQNWPFERIAPELNKVSLRHFACHCIYDGKSPEAQHGTNHMYNQHLLAGEEPCDSCKDAHAEYQRNKRAQDKANEAAGIAKRVVSTDSEHVRKAANIRRFRAAKKAAALADPNYQPPVPKPLADNPAAIRQRRYQERKRSKRTES
jgi:hypothetical protein